MPLRPFEHEHHLPHVHTVHTCSGRFRVPNAPKRAAKSSGSKAERSRNSGRTPYRCCTKTESGRGTCISTVEAARYQAHAHEAWWRYDIALTHRIWNTKDTGHTTRLSIKVQGQNIFICTNKIIKAIGSGTKGGKCASIDSRQTGHFLNWNKITSASTRPHYALRGVLHSPPHVIHWSLYWIPGSWMQSGTRL
jgi:hypothetical protein